MSTTTSINLEFDLADKIRKAMRESGVGVQDLADALEVSRGSVGNWVNGHVVPNVRTVHAIAAVTGVPYSWLKGGETTNGPASEEDWAEFLAWCARRDSNPQPSDP